MIISLTKHHPLFKSLRWVTLAASKDLSHRVALNYVKVEGNRFLATDGYRLHMCTPEDDQAPKNLGWKNGLYKPAKITKSEVILTLENGDYPQYRNIIPETEVCTKICEVGQNPGVEQLSKAFTIAVRAIDHEKGVNYKYFSDFLDTGEGVELLYPERWSMGGIVLKSPTLFGVLCPIVLTNIRG